MVTKQNGHSDVQREALGLTQGFVISFHVNSIGWWAILLLLSSQPSNNMLVELNRTSMSDLVLLAVRFCHNFLPDLHCPPFAVAAGSYSKAESAKGTSKDVIFKTLHLSGNPLLYSSSEQN